MTWIEEFVPSNDGLAKPTELKEALALTAEVHSVEETCLV